jgi:hypothetical protein
MKRPAGKLSGIVRRASMSDFPEGIRNAVR